jgi:hypothetical protein
MKISWAFNSLPPNSVAAARSCLTINLLGLPGLGSWIAGRKVGLIQGAMAITGLIMTVACLVFFVAAWIRTGSLPEGFPPHLLLGVAGVFVFGLAWLWSLATGLAMLRAAHTMNQ